MALLPHYTHIINPKLKHIYLSVDSHGDLIIKSPKVPFAQIETLLLKKSAWINKAREKVSQKKHNTIAFSKEDSLYFMGERYELQILPHTTQTKLTFDGVVFGFSCAENNAALLHRKIDQFYKHEAQTRIPPLVNYWSEVMSLSPRSIRFRKTKRQWGSCSARNDLSFNTMLMKLPLGVIEYVVVHELAHIVHKHHQKAFWELVQKHLPHYQTQKEILKHYTT
ncbi:MAG: hypothetical protein RLZZ428_736 [Pseudomonadota bacterium]|jgi:predicted metal-dependent hydrolase